MNKNFAKNFAIRGHLRRGDEVIKILEMLGGKTSYECRYKDGFDSYYFFFINTDENRYIDGLAYNSEELKNYNIFTLEEFIKKFPYKVGDKVIHDGDVLPIIRMKWDFSRNIVIYTLKYNYGEIDCYDYAWIRPYKEETFGESIEKTINECLFGGNEETMEGVYADNEINCYHQDFGDKVRIRLGNDFEIKVEDNKTYIVKKQPQYPKTYDECCSVLNIPNDERYIDVDVPLDFNKLLYAFTELLICRNAYWKIIGEQMGLGKPWEPDWEDSNFKYCLKKMGDNIEKSSEMTISCILAFPTEEILDIFYNNFKNTIEQCKELL
jgi:hypothetical protein